MLASQARLLLGLPETTDQNARYAVWRSDIAGYMGQNSIVNQTQAGAEKWDELKDCTISHQYACGYKASYLKGRNSLALQEALQTILMDVRAKESKKTKIIAAGDAFPGAGTAPGGDPKTKMRLLRANETELSFCCQ